MANFTVHRGPALVSGINWTILPKENWVILGANGSGKSTLVNALAAYITPSGGTMEVLGQTYGQTDWRDLRRKIGLVSAHLASRMEDSESAGAIVAGGETGILNAGVRPTGALAKRAKKLLGQVGLRQQRDQPWGQLSQGERQRVLIARAQAVSPVLLILDEPCAGLDPVARTRFLKFLDHWMRRPRSPAVLFVTHHVEEISPAFTHLLLLRRGRLSAAGPLRQTLTSSHLSKAFQSKVSLQKWRGMYFLLSERIKND